MRLPLVSRVFPEGVGNWRRRRFLQTGKGFVAERATRRLRSSLPIYRNRINPATGRPRRDDVMIYVKRDEGLGRLREQRPAGRDPEAWERSGDAFRSAPAEHYRSVTPRSNPWRSADAVLGTGTADRVLEAMRQANANPWDVRQPKRVRSR
jgi:hypothetical protein